MLDLQIHGVCGEGTSKVPFVHVRSIAVVKNHPQGESFLIRWEDEDTWPAPQKEPECFAESSAAVAPLGLRCRIPGLVLERKEP